VLAHYLLATENEDDKRVFYGNLMSACMIFSHDGPNEAASRRSAVEEFLEKAGDLKDEVRLRIRGHEYFTRRDVVWVQRNRRVPEKKDASFYTRESLEEDGYEVLDRCPVCGKENSFESFACCEEHRTRFLRETKEKFHVEESARIARQWAAKSPDERREIGNKIATARLKWSGKKQWITNGVESTQVNKTDRIPDGWRLGRTWEEGHTWSEEARNRVRGVVGVGVYVNKDGVTRRVPEEEAASYLEDGWVRGNGVTSKLKGKTWKQKNRTKRHFMHRDGKERQFASEEIEQARIDGWVDGRNPESYSEAFNNAQNRGRVWVNDGTRTFLVFPEDVDKYFLGRLSMPPYECDTRPRVWVHRGLETKRVLVSDLENFLNDGWSRGRIEPRMKERKPSMDGRVRMTNDVEEVSVILDDVEGYLKRGWKIGIKRRNLNKEPYEWMRKDGVCNRVLLEDVEERERDGWERGRLRYSHDSRRAQKALSVSRKINEILQRNES
jgi:hypothetical protein